MAERRILAAVDGSIYSEKVVEKAIECAKMMQAQIVLLHCHKRYPKLLGQPYRDQMISEIMDKTESTIAPYLQRLEESGADYVSLALEEPAGSKIPMTAEIEKCEMIIMGSRGRTDLEGLILGSVAHRVLHLANCPVLVVK